MNTTLTLKKTIATATAAIAIVLSASQPAAARAITLSDVAFLEDNLWQLYVSCQTQAAKQSRPGRKVISHLNQAAVSNMYYLMIKEYNQRAASAWRIAVQNYGSCRIY